MREALAGSLRTAAAAPRASTRRRVVARAAGPFGEVFVVEERGRRALRFGSLSGVDQSVYDPSRPDHLVSAYLHAVVLGALLAEPLESALLIGLGGGGFLRFARRHFPELRLDAVELDPVVVRLARRHFAIRPGPRLAIHVADAATHLAELAAERRYDLVVVDAYDGPEIPPALRSPAFFRNLRRALRPRGIAIANIGMPEARVEDLLLRRLSRVFGGRCFELRNSRDDNRIVVAARHALPGTRELVRKAREVDASRRFRFRLEGIARTRRGPPRPTTGSR